MPPDEDSTQGLIADTEALLDDKRGDDTVDRIVGEVDRLVGGGDDDSTQSIIASSEDLLQRQAQPGNSMAPWLIGGGTLVAIAAAYLLLN